MATYTNYKKLEKPLSVDKYNIAVANKNNDVIDSELHKLDLKNQSQDELFATKESLNSEASRATTKEKALENDLNSEITRAKLSENDIKNNLSNETLRAKIAEENNSNNLIAHISNKNNPHEVTKEQIDLGNVDNTSDIDKPVSTAQHEALDEYYQQATGYTDQKIIDLLNTSIPITLTQEEYDALTDTEKNNGRWYGII